MRYQGRVRTTALMLCVVCTDFDGDKSKTRKLCLSRSHFVLGFAETRVLKSLKSVILVV